MKRFFLLFPLLASAAFAQQTQNPCDPIIQCVAPQPAGETSYDFSVFPAWIQEYVEILPMPAALRYEIALTLWWYFVVLAQ